MFEAIGRNTKKVYARGCSRADIFRTLQMKYPTKVDHYHFKNRGVNREMVYPEPLKIIRRKK